MPKHTIRGGYIYATNESTSEWLNASTTNNDK